MKKHGAALAKLPERRLRNILQLMLTHGATLDSLSSAAPALNPIIDSLILERATKQQPPTE